MLGAKRSVSSSLQLVLSRKTTTLRHPLGSLVRQRQPPPQQRRLVSGSATTNRPPPIRRKQSRNRNHQKHAQQQQQQPPIPRWPAMVSVMIVPAMFAAWGISDWMFGARTNSHNEELRRVFDEQTDRHSTTMPTLFHCVVRKTTGVTHCLPGVKLGDVVEVLEEGVGPDRAYNLCRLAGESNDADDGDVYGWFPIRWMQTMEQYEAMVQKQLKNLAKTKYQD